MQTNLALKEWAVVVAALDKGEQIILLRKGGITEKGFDIKNRNFLFYPTLFHEMEKAVDGRYHLLLERVAAATATDTITISNWASVDEVLPTKNLEALLHISDHYVYTPEYIKDRFDWRGDTPMTLLFVRAYRLPETRTLPVISKYRGCKSWVDLYERVELEGSEPVLGQSEFETRKAEIKSQLFTTALW